MFLKGNGEPSAPFASAGRFKPVIALTAGVRENENLLLIAASIGAPPARSGDIAVSAERPLRVDDMRALEAYDPWLSAVADVMGQPTLFQPLLPREARLSEMREALVKTPSHDATLQRLRLATPRLTDSTDALTDLI